MSDRVKCVSLVPSSVVQCSAVQFSAVQCSAVQCNVVPFSSGQCSELKNSVVQYHVLVQYRAACNGVCSLHIAALAPFTKHFGFSSAVQ